MLIVVLLEIDFKDQYVDLTSKATSSVFDSGGKLLAGAAAIIGALTVANRISSYRRYKKPSLLERLFHLNYKPAPPTYKRNFRPRLEPQPMEPRRTIKRPPPQPSRAPQRMPGHTTGSGHTHRGPSGHGGHGR